MTEEYDLFDNLRIPSQVALVAYHGTSGRALTDRERVQQVRETILHQLVYYETAIVVDGREDERSAKVKRQCVCLSLKVRSNGLRRAFEQPFGERNALREREKKRKRKKRGETHEV